MRVRTYEEIKKGVIDKFTTEYPGESVSSTPFSIYILDIYCTLVETHELYRYMVRTNNDL
jgi:hypothetical protein